MANITLRSDLANPLTIEQVDANFTNLNTDKLEVSQFTGAEILTRIKTVDGTGSGLDADLLDGHQPASTNTASTIVVRDSSGNFSAGTITATLNGNASTVTDGVYTSGSYSNPSWLTALAGSKVTSIPNSSLTNSSISLNGTSVSLGGSYDITAQSLSWATGTQTFTDNKFILADNSNSTRRAQFDCVNISTGTTRTISFPNASGTLATQEYVQTSGQNSQGTKTVQSISAGVPSVATGSNGDIIYQY
jgi:hypothetical protein